LAAVLVSGFYTVTLPCVDTFVLRVTAAGLYTGLLVVTAILYVWVTCAVLANGTNLRKQLRCICVKPVAAHTGRQTRPTQAFCTSR